MSEQSVRRSVPPRELAATITARSVLRAGWAVAAVYLTISFLSLVELWIVRAYPVTMVVPLAALLVTAGALAALARRPGWVSGTVFLVVGGLAAFVYVYGLLSADPTLNEDGTYLVNRMAFVLLLVGAVSARLIHGLLWCVAGWLIGSLATSIAQLMLGLAVRPGYGPVVALAIYLTIIVMFLLIRRSQRRFAPDFAGVEVETARMAGQRELEERAIPLQHDTVHGDHVAVAGGKDILDERTRARYLSDIEAVTNARLEPRAAESAEGGDPGEGLRHELLAVISDFRWRGLTVDVSGGEAMSARLAPGAADALVGAVRGCLENVLRHAGSATAELFLDSSDRDLSVMVVDHGIGFDPNDIPPNRLGIRRSLVQRIEGNGGTVRIWSAVGAGTSIVISLPLEAEDA
jgi:signal transduction histidine kinase